MTILIDTNTGKPISQIFPNGYFVDGKKPKLPAHIVEAEVIDTPEPKITQYQTLSFVWLFVFNINVWEKVWTITEKEILPEYAWHLNKPFRVVVNNDIWKDWFSKKRDHEDYLTLTGKEL